MMGAIVGKAAAICIRQAASPRGVHERHVAVLHELMRTPLRRPQPVRETVYESPSRVRTPSTSRSMPSGLASLSAGGSRASGTSW